MKKNRMTRAAAIFLIAALLAGCEGGAASEVTGGSTAETEEVLSLPEGGVEPDGNVYTPPVRTAVDYSEMTPDLFDEEGFKDAQEQMIALLDEEDSLSELESLYDYLVDQEDRLSTDYGLLMIISDSDYTDDAAQDAVNDESVLYTEMLDSMYLTFQQVITDETYGRAMGAYIGDEDLVEGLLYYEGANDTTYELLDERNEIEDNYHDIYYSDDEDLDQQMGELYLQLLDNMIADAENEGYDSYAQMAYESSYSRDFDPEDVEILHDFVADFAIPYMMAFEDAVYESPGLIKMYKSYSVEKRFDMVRDAVSSVSEGSAAAFSLLEEHQLYDMEDSDTKNNVGYTVSLPYYGCAFIFDNPYGTVDDVCTLIHEFGHYYENIHNQTPDLYSYSRLDVAEIHSQGMEMLMMEHMQEIYGTKLGITMTYYGIRSMLSAIVSGYVQDSFQQQALAARMAGKLNTPDDITALYQEVVDSLGSEYYSRYYAGNWYEITHTFESPFYYIAYCTSAAAALEILAVSQEDYDGAVEIYEQIVDSGMSRGYCETLELAGLENPLTEEGQEYMIEVLGDYFDEELSLVGITDVIEVYGK